MNFDLQLKCLKINTKLTFKVNLNRIQNKTICNDNCNVKKNG